MDGKKLCEIEFRQDGASAQPHESIITPCRGTLPKPATYVRNLWIPLDCKLSVDTQGASISKTYLYNWKMLHQTFIFLGPN